ncbi:probable pectate lyase 5 isoform X2 [Physcomitrium patens]|uniref:probable pectate lyase 5 isoform X2 n=1 Tax=Physcomitrium patens TaxID=3218 RepID=UPI000D1567FF|nr:probable pectate lyase 5 isoform X2 [Physcomitrium patens]|eukprot:XP_024397499.1 probable pectate lyase 5 isoform X2 [Physcomitrella patens]
MAIPQLHHATSTEGSVNKLHTHGKTELGAEEQVKAHFNERGKMQGSEVRRQLATSACQTGNSIDDCWRCDSSWETNRQSLADCAIGFGKNAVGGKHGSLYVVTNDSDDDVVNPSYGTLRWAAIQTEPLWIIFSQDTSIALTQELIMNSYKTIDGRGYNVQISGGAGITIQGISNIIIHGIRMFNLVPTGPAMVRDSPAHYGHRLRSDGSAISIFAGTNVWLDHLYLSDCTTNLISAIEASTFITVSNSYFTNHDKVMLFGAHPEDTFDTVMQVTVAYNHFGTGLTQRMPRCRFGYFHVFNNDYLDWKMYAIGGSQNPTILSEGNRFKASDNNNSKEVTKRVADGGNDFGGWENWNWRSSDDMFLNGAFFQDSGSSNIDSSLYEKATSFSAKPSSHVETLTANAGPFQCGLGGYLSCDSGTPNTYGGSGGYGSSPGWYSAGMRNHNIPVQAVFLLLFSTLSVVCMFI